MYVASGASLLRVGSLRFKAFLEHSMFLAKIIDPATHEVLDEKTLRYVYRRVVRLLASHASLTMNNI
jgi:hypothetical protein